MFDSGVFVCALFCVEA